MRYTRCLFVLALTLSACSDNGTDIIIDEPDDFTVLATYRATLTGLPARPQAGGNVTTDLFGSFMKATAQVTGLVPAATYQWRIFYGTCAARIAAHGPNASPPAYPPITADANGGGSSIATVAGRLRADSTYHVRFFIPLTGPPVDTTWAACGDLARS